MVLLRPSYVLGAGKGLVLPKHGGLTCLQAIVAS